MTARTFLGRRRGDHAGSGRARRRWASVAVAATALGLAACGVPSSGPPLIDGGSTLGTGSNQSGQPINPPVPGDFADPSALVTSGLLYAVAGQTDTKDQIDDYTAFGPPTAAWVKELAAKESDTSVPVNVVRIAPEGIKEQGNAGGTQVTVEAYPVGVFDTASGSITPAVAAKVEKLTFEVASTANGLRITAAPEGLYVVDAVFDPDDQYYTPRTIYFWAADGGMIGDLRYVSKALSTRQVATTVVTWLLAGPPKWMGNSAISTMPQGTALYDPVITVDSDTQAYELNLKQTQPLKYASQFAAEVAWSLPPTGLGMLQPVEMYVNKVQVTLPSAADFLGLNQARPRSTAPIAYSIKDGKVQGAGLASTNGALQTVQSGIGQPAQVLQDALRQPTLSPAVSQALASDTNSNVTSAAIHDPTDTNSDRPGDDRVDVAFVRTVDDASTLWVSQSAAAPHFDQVNMPPGDLGQLHWIPNAHALAILDGGKLYVVVGKNVIHVPVTGAPSIAAFSVASDGRRIAYVTADGRVLVGLIDIETTPEGTTAVASTPRAINVRPQLDSATAVAWSSMSTLVVGGPSDRQTGQTIEINMDGVYTLVNVELRDYGTTSILGVASYPLDPLGNFSSPVLVQTSLGSSAGRSSEEGLPGVQPFFED